MILAPILTRSEKGSALTHPEMDRNLTRMENAINSLFTLFGVSLKPDGTLQDGSVITAMLADRAVTARKLALDALAVLTDTGTANALVVANTPAASAYTTGTMLRIKVANANTGATTVNMDGIGARAVKKNFNEDLVAGDIVAGQIIDLSYDGTNFQLISPVIPPYEIEELKQFITFTSNKVAIPASGGSQVFVHNLVDAASNALRPFMVRAVLVREALGTQSIGGLSIQQFEEIDVGCVWNARHGTDVEDYNPAFRVTATDTQVKVGTYYPNGLSIPSVSWADLGSSQNGSPQLTPADYRLKVYAMALNPDFAL